MVTLKTNIGYVSDMKALKNVKMYMGEAMAVDMETEGDKPEEGSKNISATTTAIIVITTSTTEKKQCH